MLPGFRSNMFLEAHSAYMRGGGRHIRATVTLTGTEVTFHRQSSDDKDKNRNRNKNERRIGDRVIQSVPLVQALCVDRDYVNKICVTHFQRRRTQRSARDEAMMLRTCYGAAVTGATYTDRLTVSITQRLQRAHTCTGTHAQSCIIYKVTNTLTRRVDNYWFRFYFIWRSIKAQYARTC